MVWVFFKILLDTWSFLGQLIPLFWTSGDMSSFNFKARVGSLINTLAEAYVIHNSFRFTSGVTLLTMYIASIFHMHVSAEVAWWDLNS